MHAGLHQTIAELRAENDELREELRAIREQAPKDYVVQHVLGCRPAVARLICAFLRSTGHLSRDTVLNAISERPESIDGGKVIDVIVHFARRALAPHGIEIQTIRGFGFGVAPDHLDRLRRLTACNTTPMAGNPMCSHSPAATPSGTAGRAGRLNALPGAAPPGSHAPKSQGE